MLFRSLQRKDSWRCHCSPPSGARSRPTRGLRGGSDEEDGGCGIDGSRKKLRLSKDQSAVLEDSFREHPTLNPVIKTSSAYLPKPHQAEGSLGAAARAAARAGRSVVPEQARKENRRLQKEVQELRALKLVSPHLYMHMSPPTTLTMCPSCERVSNANSADRRAGGSIAPAAAGDAAVCHRPIAVRPQQQSLASS
ncbi:hypothetical protein PR202_ga19478 [Eleusine coracana subsp. coracana]|uniref:Uncharacterized protein n=1 Tax=Eleusine coracana subsp. coracana TaxID=191504 RepID=A0AAV5CUT5_ELECO|nr:hypothetical protein PR202_ga19478 [Eleusine coracana subsp. coracana]